MPGQELPRWCCLRGRSRVAGAAACGAHRVSGGPQKAALTREFLTDLERSCGERGFAAEGGEAMGVGFDVLDATSVADGFAAVERRFGPIDVLINTVGTHIEQPAEEVTLDAWDTVMDVNLRGAFVLSQAAAQSMIAHQKGGSIIHVTSVRSGLGVAAPGVPVFPVTAWWAPLTGAKRLPATPR